MEAWVAQMASAWSPVAVRSLAEVPEAFGRLALLVAEAGHVRPRTAGRLAADHARSLAMLAELLERRDRVPGATAPALLGAAAELRLHAVRQVVVRAEARGWHSDGRDDDPRPRRQMDRIRSFLSRHEGRLSRSPTDSDLHVAVAALRPALLFAPALNHAISRHVHGEQWQSADPANAFVQASLLSAAQEAQDSAVRLAQWLPTEPPRQVSRPGSGRNIDPPSWEITR